MNFTAVVLAGSRPGGDPLARHYGETFKALIPIAGKAMVRWPVDALLASPTVARLIVVTQQPDALRAVLPDDARLSLRPAHATIAETIAALLGDDSAPYPLLVTTADHALLTPAMVAAFTAAVGGADLAVGVVEQRAMIARFPEAKRTWIGFRGGRYSGANLFAFGSDKALAVVDRWRAVEQDRKTGWRVLAALGPALLLGALLKVRTLDQSAAAVGRKLGLTIRAVALDDPLAAVDVDKPADHALAQSILAARA